MTTNTNIIPFPTTIYVKCNIIIPTNDDSEYEYKNNYLMMIDYYTKYKPNLMS